MSVGTYWPWEPTATLRSALCISAVGLAARGASAPTEGERGGVAAARLQLIIIIIFLPTSTKLLKAIIIIIKYKK